MSGANRRIHAMMMPTMMMSTIHVMMVAGKEDEDDHTLQTPFDAVSSRCLPLTLLRSLQHD